MDKNRTSFRSKMLALFGLAMLTSGLLTYILYLALQSYYRSHARLGDTSFFIRQIIREVGDVNFFMLVFVPLSIFFFLLLTRSYSAYFAEISRGISRLAEGDFAAEVRVASGDELQTIAEDINRAGAKLKTAVERGEFAENSKDRLVLNLAHDLRTPLTSVIGYLDTVLTNDRLTAEQVRHFTTIAYTKSRRLEKLVEELFEITRMNYGNLPVKRESIDLSELLAQLCEEFYPIFEQNRLTARLDVPERMDIQADGDLLARVFENLLVNAARYGEDGQYVDIRARREEDEAVVEIVNYGDPIPKAELPHVFDMFYTGDKARTHQGGGTGLGLFIAHNIVARHGGAITADSDVTRTRFEVRLPGQGQDG